MVARGNWRYPMSTLSRELDSPAPSHSWSALLRAGLLADRKEIPTPWLYDGAGSRLYEAVTRTAEYYLGRVETELLARLRAELAVLVGGVEVVELGSGASVKTMHLLEALGARERRLVYRPVDVSGPVLVRSRRVLERTFPGIRVHPFEGTHDVALSHLEPVEQRLVVFLGGTLGNFSDAEQERFAAHLAKVLAPGHLFLLGFDLRPGTCKSVERLLDAYDDGSGAMARFNRNALGRLAREYGADWHPPEWRHVARYDRVTHRIELALASPRTGQIRIPGLDLAVPVRQDEEIHTAISRKFDTGDLAAWFEARGFRLRASWTDDRGWIALALFERV